MALADSQYINFRNCTGMTSLKIGQNVKVHNTECFVNLFNNNKTILYAETPPM